MVSYGASALPDSVPSSLLFVKPVPFLEPITLAVLPSSLGYSASTNLQGCVFLMLSSSLVQNSWLSGHSSYTTMGGPLAPYSSWDSYVNSFLLCDTYACSIYLGLLIYCLCLLITLYFIIKIKGCGPLSSLR